MEGLEEVFVYEPFVFFLAVFAKSASQVVGGFHFALLVVVRYM